MEKLTGKGKHTVRLGNHLHTNMISKLAIMRRVQMQDTGKLKTIFFIHRLLQQNLMDTANQNSTIDKKEKETQTQHYVSHQITTEENKRGSEEKRPTNTIPN